MYDELLGWLRPLITATTIDIGPIIVLHQIGNNNFFCSLAVEGVGFLGGLVRLSSIRRRRRQRRLRIGFHTLTLDAHDLILFTTLLVKVFYQILVPHQVLLVQILFGRAPHLSRLRRIIVAAQRRVVDRLQVDIVMKLSIIAVMRVGAPIPGLKLLVNVVVGSLNERGRVGLGHFFSQRLTRRADRRCSDLWVAMRLGKLLIRRRAYIAYGLRDDKIFFVRLQLDGIERERRGRVGQRVEHDRILYRGDLLYDQIKVFTLVHQLHDFVKRFIREGNAVYGKYAVSN